MDSLKYWRKREEEQRKHNIAEEKEFEKEIQSLYRQEQKAIEDRIFSFYSRYASSEGITMAEAKKRVSKMDVSTFAEQAKKYVKEKDFSKRANEELKLYNLTMRINHQQLLEYQLALETCASGNELEKFMQEKLEGRTIEEIERQAGILGDSILDQEKTVKSIVNASFHNATFSDRVWANQAILRGKLNNILTNALVQGRNPREYIGELTKVFDVSRKQAERLLRTELARVQTDAQMKSYEKMDIDEYIFHALGDACDICKGLNYKHFKIKDSEVGENLPPMHPNCRCSTGPYMDTEDFDEWLDGIDELGLTWEEWKNANREERRKPSKLDSNFVLSGSIMSQQYKGSFQKIGENDKLTNKIYRKSLDMLKHRNGTEYEDMTFIKSIPDSKGVYNSLTNRRMKSSRKVVPTEKMKSLILNASKRSIIAIHNHPGSSVPSLSDLYNAKRYKYGLIVCHNGKIFKYAVDENITENQLKIADSELYNLNKYLYDNSVNYTKNISDKIKALKDVGVDFEVIR